MDMTLKRVGVIHSPLTSRASAPKQGTEGDIEAWLEIDPEFAEAARDLQEGRKIVLVTWLHLSDRDTLDCHPRGDVNRPRRGIFSTRSPDRPNPLGLHEVRIIKRESGTRFLVGPLDTLDGTPVVDIKPAI